MKMRHFAAVAVCEMVARSGVQQGFLIENVPLYSSAGSLRVFLGKPGLQKVFLIENAPFGGSRSVCDPGQIGIAEWSPDRKCPILQQCGLTLCGFLG